MALDGQVYSYPDWQFAVKTEANIGTALVTTMNLMNIDGPVTFTPGTVMITDIRSGTSGRAAGVADTLICPEGVWNEISFSAIMDTVINPVIMPLLTGTTIDTGPASHDIVYNYNPPELTHAAASAVNKTATLALIHPEAAKSIIIPGATLTSLTITGDIEEENGRFKMSGTFGSGYKPSYDQATPSSMTAYGATFLYLNQATTTTTIAGCANSVIKSLGITINNPSMRVGFQGANGDPQAIARSIPEVECLLDATIKVDANTASLHSTWDAGTTVANEVSDNATWASATNFGVKADYGKIIGVAENDSGAAYYDVSQKLFAHTSGDVIEVLI